MATPERWRLLSPYLDEALDIVEPFERDAWLSSLRARNSTVAAELEALLAEHKAIAAGGFLEQPPPFAPPTLAGQRVGAYTLVAPIGDGGMGTVWLAERNDGRFDRRVAIKFLNAFVAGRGVERFRREGEILARLAHPNIAQLVDAGVTESGQPYFILELVDGEPIDVYCDGRRLDLDARIRLFLEVLDAVAHAHVNLIVHRDIKPSNVLVGRDGHVKLLDFGIAKLIEGGGRATDPTLLTREDGLALTPKYAAPEQLTGKAVTTATDVYALGVLLFVLLTGQHPAGDDHTAPAAIMRAIVDAEPGRASDVVSRHDIDPTTRAMRAAKRATAPDRLRRALRGDIDTIVNKALKKNPADRYASVTALAEDLRRYLRHEPISARPDTLAYRAAKFVRRNGVAVVAASFAVSALTVGLFVVNRERVLAENRFRQLRSLSGQVFELDRAIRDLPGSVAARQQLVSASLAYLEGLAADRRGDLDLAEEVSKAYVRVARIQGVPIEVNLGDAVSAERSLQKAEALSAAVLAARPRDRVALRTSADIASDRMILAESDRRTSEALRFAREAGTRVEAFLNAGAATDAERMYEGTILGNIALALVNMHRYGEAIPYARRQMAILTGIPASREQMATSISLMANALRFEGNLDGALQAIRKARAEAEQATYRNARARTFNMYGVLLREGLILGEDGGVSLDRPSEAIEPLQKAFDMADGLAREEARDTASRGRAGTTGRELGNILRRDDPRRALAMYDAALGRLAEIPANLKARRDRALTLAESSYALRSLHREPEARHRIDEALRILSDVKDLPADRIAVDSAAFSVLRAQANDLEDAGDVHEAVRLSRQLLDKVERSAPQAEADLRNAAAISLLFRDLARQSARAGDAAGANAIAGRRRSLWQAWDRKLPGNAFVARQLAQRDPS